MNALAHGDAIARRFAARLRAGDAVFLSGAAPVPLPRAFLADQEVRYFSGVNRFVLMQVMSDRGWDDPRFVTAGQLARAGWQLEANASRVALRLPVVRDELGLLAESPGLKQCGVFNASQVLGVSPFIGSEESTVDDLTVAAQQMGVSTDPEPLVIQEWLTRLQRANGVSGGVQALDAVEDTLELVLAAALLRGHNPSFSAFGEMAQFREVWAERIDADPSVFFRAVQRADLIAAQAIREVARVTKDRVTEVAIKQNIQATAKAIMTSRSGDRVTGIKASTWLQAQFERKQAVLSVPFEDRVAAGTLGAKFFAPEKKWFVPPGVDITLFDQWRTDRLQLSDQVSQTRLAELFGEEMEKHGFVVKKGIVDDGCWHNVPVDSKKNKNNKSGSYIFSSTGARNGGAIGTMCNNHTGERWVWTQKGSLKTPETIARSNGEAERVASEALAAALQVQDLVAEHAREIWQQGSGPEGHGYVIKKSITTSKLRQVSGEVLLRYPEFKSPDGKTVIKAGGRYLLVPMQDRQGNLRGVQAINEDGTIKAFMRGGQKKGLMCMLGARSFDDLLRLEPDTVLYAEGIATGKSLLVASGKPVVVCFDAGNVVEVASATVPLLASDTQVVVAVDNDQYFVERALGQLADLLGVNCLVGNRSEHAGSVLVADGRTSRAISLGGVVADGEWHDVRAGKYCVTLIDGAGLVSGVKVDVVRDGSRKVTATHLNTGLEVGKKVALSFGDRNIVVAVPAFRSLAGRPTDWNDLALANGVDEVRSSLIDCGVGVGVAITPGIVEKSPLLRFDSQVSVSR